MYGLRLRRVAAIFGFFSGTLMEYGRPGNSSIPKESEAFCDAFALESGLSRDSGTVVGKGPASNLSSMDHAGNNAIGETPAEFFLLLDDATMHRRMNGMGEPFGRMRERRE